MKTIYFNHVDITNFKGIENLTVDFDKLTSFRGANGTGKTTIADAINWALFNKDSSGASTFPIKRKDEQGNDLHNIIVEVNLDITVNDEHHLLRRRQEENWVLKRGFSDPVMEGNVQTLYYNDSVLKTKEYSDAVNAIVDEDTFRLLTSPTFFMVQIDAKKRREKLMKLVGSETEVENSIKVQPKFAMLLTEWIRDINRNKTFGQFKEYMEQKSKENKQEIERLPYQIDELKRTITEDLNENNIKSLIAGYQKELKSLSEPRPSEKPPEVIGAEIQLRDKQKVLSEYLDKCQSQFFSKRSEIAHTRQDVEYKIGSLNGKMALLKNKESELKNTLEFSTRKRDELRVEYHRITGEQMEAPSIGTKCPACGQSLPEVDVQSAIDKAHTEWENNRKNKIEQIMSDGTKYGSIVGKTEIELDLIKTQINELFDEVITVQAQLSTLPNISELKEEQFVDATQKSLFESEINQLKEIINNYYKSVSDTSGQDEIRSRRDQLQAMINDQNRRLGAFEQQRNAKERIALLEENEKKLLILKNTYKNLVYLCEEFEKEKNEEFERQLSSHFTRIKWRLFEQQLNGGYRQVCDALLDGKPYDAQSTGEKLFSGIDIIQTFQGVYEVESPIIIDNRESLTMPVNTQSQTISMYADDSYNTLTKI